MCVGMIRRNMRNTENKDSCRLIKNQEYLAWITNKLKVRFDYLTPSCI